jgi:DNA modification methylase
MADNLDGSKPHPTMKPVAMTVEIIKMTLGQNIVDLFGGSGSTLIAAEQTNRICYMMELDPKYCDVIIERWERLTGQKAELLPAKAD